MKQKLLNQKWFIWLMLILFFPVGLYFLWTSNNTFEHKTKSIVTVIICCFIFFAIIAPNPAKSDSEVVDNSISETQENDSKTVHNSLDEQIDQTSNITEISAKNDIKEPINNSTIETINSNEKQTKPQDSLLTDESLKENKLIEVDGGDQSGYREPNVIVDIGFGDREYYAYTNKYGQLVQVTAKKITLQNDSTEPVTSKGRYYSDEAKVPGVESPTLDEGHVIADSLGGVSNAYNICPQNSTLNRHGNQAYMEKVIRDALKEGGTCIDFTAIISYPNTETMIPSHYSFIYTLNGELIHDEFDNVNPDEVNAKLESNISKDQTNIVKNNTDNKQQKEQQTQNDEPKIIISNIDKVAEIVTIKNNSDQNINITGWSIVSVTGNQTFYFPQYTLKANSSCTVTSGKNNSNNGTFYWGKRNIWNNSKSDPGELHDNNGKLIISYDD